VFSESLIEQKKVLDLKTVRESPIRTVCGSKFQRDGAETGFFVCLCAWGLTALSAQIGYIAP